MCGIHGLIAFTDRARPDASLHARMGGVTVHRGPDDDGCFVEGDVLLGMRRLSIIDLAGGHQPIANEDGSLQVVWPTSVLHAASRASVPPPWRSSWSASPAIAVSVVCR